jgi:site-specific recombinase XerD
MNKVVHAVLKSWKDQQEDNSHLVFPSKSNEPFDNIRKSWSKIRDTAKLADFRWHDLRHHFASKLVMAEVDLNTVRELLGHADLKMTLRYAHLAPEHLEDAVAKLI